MRPCVLTSGPVLPLQPIQHGLKGNDTVRTDAVNLLYREAIKGRCSLKIKLEREERSSKGSSKCDWKHYIYSCAPEMLIRRWIHSLRLVGV